MASTDAATEAKTSRRPLIPIIAAALTMLCIAGVLFGCSSDNKDTDDAYKDLAALMGQLRSATPDLGDPVSARREGQMGLAGGGAHLYAAFKVEPATWSKLYESLNESLTAMAFTPTIASATSPPESSSDPRNFVKGRGTVMASLVYFDKSEPLQLGSKPQTDAKEADYVVVSFTQTP